MCHRRFCLSGREFLFPPRLLVQSQISPMMAPSCRGLWAFAATALLLCFLPHTHASIPDAAAAPAAAVAAPAAAPLHAVSLVSSPSSVVVGGNGGGSLRSKSGLPHTPSRFAWVLMHYEGTPKDDEYLLGLRVLIRSIQETKTPYDIVVITSSNVRDSTKKALLDDGALLNEVANLQNPVGAPASRAMQAASSNAKH